MELERELNANRKQLEELRSKGKAAQTFSNKRPDLVDQNFEDHESEVTIYRPAVQKSLRGSSSSEEELQIEQLPVRIITENNQSQQQPETCNDVNDNFVERELIERDQARRQDRRTSKVIATTPRNSRPVAVRVKSPEEIRAEKLIRDAENAKARVYDVPGRNLNFSGPDEYSAAIIDENY